MSPALTQALWRLLVIAVVGALTAVGANVVILNGTLPNAAYLIPVITAIIDAVLKYLGGATIPVGNASVSANKSLFDWPHFWSV